MPNLRINLEDAQSFEPIPDDTYTVEVTDISEVKKGSKSSYVTVELTVAEGEYENRKLWTNLMIDGKAAGMFVDFINKALGTDYKVEDLEELEINTDDLIGAKVGVTTKAEEYPEGSGDFRPQVKKILPLE